MGKSWAERRREDPEWDRVFNRERLILGVAEMLWGVLKDRGVDVRELSSRLKKKPPGVRRLLDGETNMTLRTLADVTRALGVDLEIRVKKHD